MLSPEYEFTVCAACGINFGMPADYIKRLRESGKGFHCPNGHSLTFGESALDKLRRENQRLVQNAAYKDDVITSEREARKHAENQTRAFKGVVTRTKKRISNGACPCCNRTFQNLARHMATKHANYQQEETEQ